MYSVMNKYKIYRGTGSIPAYAPSLRGNNIKKNLKKKKLKIFFYF